MDNNFDRRLLAAEAQGPRDEQQDTAICLSSREHGAALLVVSDGVGGNSGGRIASHVVKEAAQQIWKETGGEFFNPRKDLLTLCRVAHERINAEGARCGIDPLATIVALYLTNSCAYWVHSGDSRLYHFRAGKLIKRTEDHSVLQILVKQGLVREDEMGAHPAQGALIQSLGGDQYKPPRSDGAEIGPDDAFLLCSDGFWERTKVEEMAQLLFCKKEEAPSLLDCAVQRALKRNGPRGDNVTAIIALPAAKEKPIADLTQNAAAAKPLLRSSLLLFLCLFLAAMGLGIFFNFARISSPGKSLAKPNPSAASDLQTKKPPEDANGRYLDPEMLKAIKAIPLEDQGDVQTK
jgi:PPM family protein phosphatase